jgi:flagellar biosynthesis/type III secretory pathway M-ring protein FliF/YscJ
MSTVAVIAIVVGALILLAIVVAIARNANRRREFSRVQTEAQHDDVQHHRGRADERRHEAELAEERAKRARAEAELDEQRAASRERDLGEEPGRGEEPGGRGAATEPEDPRSTERR